MTSDPRVDAFLDVAGWGGARRHPLPADASTRRYVRLARGSARAILMVAPPDTAEEVRRFLAIGGWLAARGFSAPAILAAAPDEGLLLLEDLGNRLLATEAAERPGDEAALYAAAGAFLAELHRHDAPDLPAYPPLMANLSAMVVDWYAPASRDRRDEIEAAVQEVVDLLLSGRPVFVHRDFHAENLLWLPDRDGPARIGVLDYQDAMRGPAAYDLASLIHDPRRPVSAAAMAAATDAYIAATGTDRDALAAQIAAASVQRSLRILGRTFARLALQQGRTSYLRFIPPAWAALQRELRHPALAGLSRTLDGLLPEPDAAFLADLAGRAGSLRGHDHAGAP